MTGTNDRPIALIGNSEEKLKEVSSFLRDERIKIDSILNIEESKTLFAENIPYIILLYFDSISEVKDFLLHLYRISDKVDILSHEFILLCTKDEAPEAARLVLDNIINDYFVYKPIYDPNRFFILIHNAKDRQKSRIKLNQYKDLHNDSLELYRNVEGLFNETVESGKDLQKSSKNDHERLAQNIKDKLTDFKEKMSTNEYEDAVEVVNQNKLNEYFSELKDVQINQEIEKHRDETSNVIGQVFEDIEKKFNQQLEGIEKQSSLKKDQITILIVDDEPKNRKVLRLILEAEGYIIEEAEDGIQAVNSVAKRQPDLILMDIMMPGLNGFAASKIIRQNKLTENIPIIIVSAHPLKENVEGSKDLGINHFIVKPIQPDTLLEKVSGCFKKTA